MLDHTNYEDLELLEALNDMYWEDSLIDEIEAQGLDFPQELRPLEIPEVKEVDVIKSYSALVTGKLGSWMKAHSEADRMRKEYEQKYGEPLTFDRDSI